MSAWQIFREVRVGDNELWRVILFFTVLLVFFVAGRVARLQLTQAAGRLRTSGKIVWPVFLESLSRSIGLLSSAIGLIQAFRFLILPERMSGSVSAATGVLMVMAVGYTLYCVVDVIYVLLNRRAERTESKLDDMLVTMLRKSLRVTIVVLTIVQAIQMLSDRPLTSLIAGLGVGSLAIALAGQESIKNFFGSLIILADKPFELGQRIMVDGHDGIVEAVGMRSTRIRTLDGNLLTFPNGELANRVIVNISRRPFIRRMMNITIPYDTPPEKVRRAIEIIKELLANHEGMSPDRPPRIFFNDFNAASLNILVIYWYHPPDFFAYMAFSEKFNFDLLRRFNEEGIEFAFPTQTLYLAGDPKRALSASIAPSETPRGSPV